MTDLPSARSRLALDEQEPPDGDREVKAYASMCTAASRDCGNQPTTSTEGAAPLGLVLAVRVDDAA
jgi:hypothetical protein